MKNKFFNDKNFVYFGICLSCITISFNVSAINAILPVISKNLNISDIDIAKIIPFYMIPYGISALIYAPLTRFFSYRFVLLATMILYGAACFLCAISNSLNELLIGRVIMGVSGASSIPLGLMLIGELFRKEVRGRLVGVFFGCSFIAYLIGIGFSGLISWRFIFYIPGVLGLFTAMFFLLFYQSKHLNSVNGYKINYFTLFTKSKIKNVFIYIGVLSALYNGIVNWYGIYFSKIYGLNKVAISILFIVLTTSGFLGQLIGGFLSDKKDRLFSCYLGLFAVSFGAMALFFKFNLFILGIVVSIIAMGWTIGHNGTSTILTDFPNEDRAVISSLNSAVRFVSGGIGFGLSGFFVAKSFHLTFLVIGFLLLIMISFVKKLV